MRTYNFCYTPADDGFGHVEVEQVYNAADHIAYGDKYEWQGGKQ